MNSLKKLSVILAFAFSSLLASQAAEPARNPSKNAALQYLKAFHFEETYGEEAEGIPLYKLLKQARGGIFTEKTEAVLDRAEPYLDKMRFGASLPYCDWGLLRWPLDSADMAHVHEGRSLANLAAARVRHLAHAGRGSEAVKLLRDSFIFSDHMASGRLLIETVAQASVQSILIETIAAELPALSQNALALLGQILDDQFLNHPPQPAAVFQNDYLFALSNLKTGIEAASPEELALEALNRLLRESGFAQGPFSSREQVLDLLATLDNYVQRIAVLLRETPPHQLEQAAREVEQEHPEARDLTSSAVFAGIRAHHAWVRFWMLRAAVAVLHDDREALAKFPEPDRGTPFTLHSEFRETFVLESEPIGPRNATVTLQIGHLPTIHSASASGDEELVRHYLERDKALLRAVDEQGRTPLHAAAANGRLEIAQRLIEHGAQINVQTSPARSELLRRFGLASGTPQPESPSKTPLGLAVEGGHDELANWLRDHGGHISRE